MSEVGVIQRRRSLSEVQALVAEYEASGLKRAEFCQQRGLVVGTLDKYRKRVHGRRHAEGKRFVPVEVVSSAAQDVHRVVGRDGALVLWPYENFPFGNVAPASRPAVMWASWPTFAH